MNRLGKVYKACLFWCVHSKTIYRVPRYGFCNDTGYLQSSKVRLFLSDYLLSLGLFLESSIILFYDNVSISDCRQVSLYARVIFLKESYKLKFCKLNAKFPFETVYFLGARRLTTSSPIEVFRNRRAAARYRALASIIPGREDILLELITNLNVILYLSTCHTVHLIVLILFMIMP